MVTRSSRLRDELGGHVLTEDDDARFGMPVQVQRGTV